MRGEKLKMTNENKRFTIDDERIKDNRSPNCYIEYYKGLVPIVDLLNNLQEERDYFERKKCEYQKRISILTTDKITLGSIMEDAETLIRLVEEQNQLTDLKMNPETVQLINRMKNKIEYYKKVQK